MSEGGGNMGVLVVSGSPKKGHGASHRLSLALVEALGRLAQRHHGEGTPLRAKLVYSSDLSPDGFAELSRASRALVLVFPLYFDGLPSRLI